MVDLVSQLFGGVNDDRSAWASVRGPVHCTEAVASKKHKGRKEKGLEESVAAPETDHGMDTTTYVHKARVLFWGRGSTYHKLPKRNAEEPRVRTCFVHVFFGIRKAIMFFFPQ